MSAEPDILVADLEAALHSLARGATRELRLVAPFIKAKQLGSVLACVAPGVRVEVTTRWRPEEVAAGVTDLEALDVCRAYGAELTLIDRLHAKLFVGDRRDVLIGSANMTARGLGSATSSNLEVLLPCRPSARSMAMTLTRLDLECRSATDAERESVARSAEAMLPVARPDPVDEPVPSRPWLPEFRSPDRLHSVYRDLSEGELEGADAAAMRDIASLDVPFDLDRIGFHRAVRDRLGMQPAIQSLDALLSKPRRFGEVSGWISVHRPEATHAERQRAGQTLIRWLQHFDGSRYRVDTPGYSEILSLAVAGNAEGLR